MGMKIKRTGIEAAREVEFGDVEDYFPGSEISVGRRARWNEARARWEEHKALAIGYAEEGDVELCHDEIAAAAGVEQDWGDAPSSRELRRHLLIEA